jgi:hypothetical protein
MSASEDRYCLDANVLINAWNQYYHWDFCRDYGRSLADPWVIAHAMAQHAIVVTKENKETQSEARVKIPNVCENMGVRWINDFDMIRALHLRFSCIVAGSGDKLHKE